MGHRKAVLKDALVVYRGARTLRSTKPKSLTLSPESQDAQLDQITKPTICYGYCAIQDWTDDAFSIFNFGIDMISSRVGALSS